MLMENQEMRLDTTSSRVSNLVSLAQVILLVALTKSIERDLIPAPAKHKE